MSFRRCSGLGIGTTLSQPSRSGPTATVLIVGRSLTPADVRALCERLQALLAETAAEVIVCDVAALADPGLDTVDALARLQLTARRLGCRVLLRNFSRDLEELLLLAGLDDVWLRDRLPPGRGGRQAEQREQRLGVEERVEPDDATV